MAIVEILPKNGTEYKLGLHTHSTLTDGNFTPEELKLMYKAEGYSALAYTDHRKCIPHEDLTDDNFVALTGTELDFSLRNENGDLVRCVHLNAISRDPSLTTEYVSMPLDYNLIRETIKELQAKGFFVTLNHPVWSNMSTEEVGMLNGVDGIEVYNSIAVWFNNYSDDSAFYECFLRRGGKAIPIAADDCHKIFADGSHFSEYYRSFTVVKAPNLSYSSIMNALDAGHCYSSTGPRIHGLWLEGDLLHVECSPVCSVFVHGKSLMPKTQEVSKTDSITEAVLDISHMRGKTPYIWVQLRDTFGRKAWAVPYWF